MNKLTSKEPEYSSWTSMIGRCTKPTYTGYRKYGDRGISVYPEWHGYPDGFARFVAYIGPRPSMNHQIDRIDSTGNYEPGNVRWATTREQARNRSSNQFIEFGGMNMCLADWATHLDIARQSLQRRLEQWPVEKALTTKRRKHNRSPAGRLAISGKADSEKV